MHLLIPVICQLCLSAIAPLEPIVASGVGIPGLQDVRQYKWAGSSLAPGDIYEPVVGNDGELSLPLVVDGQVHNLWTATPGTPTLKAVEAGTIPELAMKGNAAKQMVVATALGSSVVMKSKKFVVSQEMTELRGLFIAGNGDMKDAYVALNVSIDGGSPFQWSKQAPSTSSRFDEFRVDFRKLNAYAKGKMVVAEVEVVDKSELRLVVLRSSYASAERPMPPWVRPRPRLDTFRLSRNLTDRLNIFRSGGPLGYDTTYDAITPEVGLSYTEFTVLRRNVNRAVFRDIRFVPREKIDSLALRLKNLVSSELATSFDGRFAKSNSVLEWMYAEALTAQMLKVRYDSRLAMENPGLTNGYVSGQVLLDMEYPTSICSGIALLTRDVGRAMGLKCRYVGGFTRDVGGVLGATSNHAWVVFEFSNGATVPADTTIASLGRDKLGLKFERLDDKVFAETVLPSTRAEWHFFLNLYYAKDEVGVRYGDLQSNWNPALISFEEFARLDTKSLTGLLKAFTDANVLSAPGG